MRILFFNTELNFRGTTVALTDYAKYNQEILNNESILAYNSRSSYEKDMTTELEVVKNLSKNFKIINAASKSLEKIIDEEKIDLAYFIRGGAKEELPSNVSTAVHAVFQFKEPHGTKYAYISKWLSDVMSEGTIPYVPHLVHLPPPTQNIRKQLNISKDKIVIGRIGGYYTFDIVQVKQAIVNLLNKTTKFIFIFVGTEPFIEHENAIFLKEINDLQLKSNFIHSCDAMIHARLRGESFGLSIAEFLYCNKPVIAWNNGHDKNHLELLKDSNTLYSSVQDLYYILENVKDMKENWYERVADFTPTNVMEKFKEVFI